MTQLTIHARPYAPSSSVDAPCPLEGIPTPALSDALGRQGGLHGLRPLPGGRVELAGPALTVQTAPGDNLAVHRALELARPGDILVIDADGCTTRAVAGEIVARYAVHRGVAGIVLDGVVRDGVAIAALPLPVWCRGTSPQGPTRQGPGSVGLPISIGGSPVAPGDYIVGDADGLVVVPDGQVGQVAVDAAALCDADPPQLQAASSGALDRSWLRNVHERCLAEEVW